MRHPIQAGFKPVVKENLSVVIIFYPRDAMLARVLAMTLYPSVRLSVSVKSRSSIETTERIELVFDTGASIHPSYTVLTGNSAISKNKGTSLWNFVPNSGLRKFYFGISIVETCYQLSSRKVDAQSAIN